MHVIVRTVNAGVFAGEIACEIMWEGETAEPVIGKQGRVVLHSARRLWYWDGAASLSQLAVDGTSKPGNCKFPVAVDKITLLGAVEIIPTTEKARESIEAVPVWSK